MCEAGSLIDGTKTATLQYDGAVLHVHNLAVSICPACGERMVSPEQARANDVKYADAKREHDGLWTAARIAEWRMRWGYSQQQAAQLLGGGVNAFSKYERGEVIQSKAMDLLMRVHDEVPGARDRLAALSGVVSKNGWHADQSQSKKYFPPRVYIRRAEVRPELHAELCEIQTTISQLLPTAVGHKKVQWEDDLAYGT